MTFTRVECRSDHDYIGRPLAFYWQDNRLLVIDVLTQIRTVQGYSFRVQASDAGIFKLDYDTDTDQWSVQPL